MPIENEDQVLAGMISLVEQSRAPEVPRDESGKFVSAKPAEQAAPDSQNAQVEGQDAPVEQPAAEGEAEAQTDGATQEGSDTVETIEIDPDEPLFEQVLDVDGKKEAKKLSLKELQQGYLRQQDYTRKTQDLAKQRAQTQHETLQVKQEASKQYGEKLEVFQSLLTKTLASEVQGVDWNKLADEDPGQYVRLSNRVNQVNQLIQSIDGELKQAKSKEEQQKIETKQAKWRETVDVLQRDVPDWGTPLVEKLLLTGKNVYGVKAEEFDDAGMIKMLHDAMKYRDLAEKKVDVSKKIALVPKVMKPGAKKAAVDPSKQVFETVRKTGRAEDALPFFENLLKR